MPEHKPEIDARRLRLRGGNHVLTAIPVGGDQWVGMIEIQSPSDAALLTPEHARQLRDWLDLMLAEHKPFSCPCGHSRAMHTDEWECLTCDGCPGAGGGDR